MRKWPEGGGGPADFADDLEELYDLQEDPCELTNLAIDPAYRDLLQQMRGKLLAWMD